MRADEIELILEDMDWNNLSKVDRDLVVMFKWNFDRDGFLLKGCCELLKKIYERANVAERAGNL